MLVPRAALRLQGTALTVLGPGFVAIEKVSRLVFLPSFVAQVLVSRTNIVVVFGIVNEGRGGEASRAGVVFFRAAFAQTADIIYPQLRHGLDTSAVGVIAVGQHLPRLASQAGGDALYRRRQLFAVVAGLGYLHVYDQRLRPIGRDLHVVVGSEGAVRLSHPARFWFGDADSGARFARTQFLQLVEGLLSPLRLFCLIRFAHLPQPPPRSFQVLPNPCLSLKAVARCLGLDLGPVLHYLLQTDQPFRAQQPQHLREQLIQLSPVLHPKTGQGVVVHRFTQCPRISRSNPSVLPDPRSPAPNDPPRSNVPHPPPATTSAPGSPCGLMARSCHEITRLRYSVN